jgi:hypothetical protein
MAIRLQLRVVLTGLMRHLGWAARFTAPSADRPVPYGRTKKALRERYVKHVAVMAAVLVDSAKGVHVGRVLSAGDRPHSWHPPQVHVSCTGPWHG